ncbi:helix-turn-helix domain-containing protein [Kibdelosporangium philippinense]|uniref:helix-turn-helix domain-containing protein n=1 Tax=Kibdelosporangium philippinense TaxID=211113 RepID=UPI0036092223
MVGRRTAGIGRGWSCRAAAQADRRAGGRGGRRAGAGPKANGFPTDMWTLARVAKVIEKVTGVRYSQTQTWTILRERLGWSRQRPARRATERDQEAIDRWEKGVATHKKAPGAEGPGSASRTSPDSPCCP